MRTHVAELGEVVDGGAEPETIDPLVELSLRLRPLALAQLHVGRVGAPPELRALAPQLAERHAARHGRDAEPLGSLDS